MMCSCAARPLGEIYTLACESILAEIWPSRMSWVSSFSRRITVVLKAIAILCRSTLMYGLKYYRGRGGEGIRCTVGEYWSKRSRTCRYR